MKQITLQLPMVSCEFCSSVYVNELEAFKNGCTGTEPDQRYSVGDIVFADFEIFEQPADTESTGTWHTKGMIRAIEKPKKLDVTLSKGTVRLIPFSSLANIGFQVPAQPCDWFLLVEPIEPKRLSGVLRPQRFRQSEVSESDEHRYWGV